MICFVRQIGWFIVEGGGCAGTVRVMVPDVQEEIDLRNGKSADETKRSNSPEKYDGSRREGPS